MANYQFDDFDDSRTISDEENKFEKFLSEHVRQNECVNISIDLEDPSWARIKSINKMLQKIKVANLTILILPQSFSRFDKLFHNVRCTHLIFRDLAYLTNAQLDQFPKSISFSWIYVRNESQPSLLRLLQKQYENLETCIVDLMGALSLNQSMLNFLRCGRIVTLKLEGSLVGNLNERQLFKCLSHSPALRSIDFERISSNPSLNIMQLKDVNCMVHLGIVAKEQLLKTITRYHILNQDEKRKCRFVLNVIHVSDGWPRTHLQSVLGQLERTQTKLSLLDFSLEQPLFDEKAREFLNSIFPS